MKTMFRLLLTILGCMILGLFLYAIDGCRATEDARFPVTVVGRHYSPAHTEMYFVYISDGNGGGQMVPQYQHYPDEWALTGNDSNGGKHCVQVSHSVYDYYGYGKTFYVAHFRGPWGWHTSEEFRNEAK